VVDIGGVIAPPPAADAVVNAPIAGRVAKVLVSEGAQVESGALLAIIENSALAVGVEEAEHNVEAAPPHGRRAAVARAARARVEQARGEVRAPRAGVVVRVYRQIGESVDDTTPIARIADLSVLEVHAQAPAAELARVAGGMPARVRALGIDAPIAATVGEVAATVEPKTALGRVRVTLATSDDVKVGTSARVEIVVGKRSTTCR
jgi:HlyD family secretion protein